MYKHILIPTDGSKISKAAARHGVSLAKALGSKVTAFFAAPAATPLVYEGLLPVAYKTQDEHAELIAKTAAKFLGAIEDACNKPGVPCRSVYVTNEFAADAIIAAAKKYRRPDPYGVSWEERDLSHAAWERDSESVDSFESTGTRSSMMPIRSVRRDCCYERRGECTDAVVLEVEAETASEC